MRKHAFSYSLVLTVIMVFLPVSAQASFTDTAVDWDLFNPPTGYTIPYTFNGQPVSDEESSSDSTNGGAAVSPALIDLASGSPNGTDPGPYDTPSFGYYNGGTPYDPNDPLTYQDDIVRFTMRVVADPAKGDGFDNYHWNILLDVDGDGYKEFWIDLFGKYSANGYDQLQILYDNSNAQTLPDTPDKQPSLRVDQFRAYNFADADSYSHTRVRAAGDGTGDYFIDIQVPLTAFKDTLGNQVLYPDSPVGFVFSTSASATDPLQKDYMTDLNFLTENDPITFGDVVNPNGDAILYFADANKNERDYYTVGESVALYLRDAFANTSETAVDTVTATVTNPVTGDDETVTLTETGPNTGIFTNLGGASDPLSTNPNNAWIPYIVTSEITTTENWTLTYNSGTGTWSVLGSVSGLQTGSVTAGSEYVSDDGQIRFTLYEDNPVNGDTITFTSYAGDPLPTSTAAGADDDGTFQVAGGETVTYSYTQTKTGGETKTLTDTAQIIGASDPFIQFTRANGTPTSNFQLTTDAGTSDKLYVTVNHAASNTDPNTAESITVTLTGDTNNPTETQTLTLVETGPDTGVFRNVTGLSTKVSDGTETPNDGLWEDIDQGEVTATFTYNGSDFGTTASLFYINDAGRVNFTNGAGTLGVDRYAVDDPIFILLSDESVTCGGTLTVTVTSSSGDSETVTLYETSTGSAVYMNRVNDLVTTAASAVVTSASATFDSDGLTAGDVFVIATGPDTGSYTIASVDGNTQLTLNQNLTAARTGIGYASPSFIAGTFDGSFTANDGVLEASHNDAITVAYQDCTDGDANPGNDIKTDTAIYNAPTIVINEVFFHPDLVTDVGATEQAQYEYIQLYNASSAAVNVTGYTVTDGDGFSYTIPQFTTGTDLLLQPGEKLYVVIVPDSGVPPIEPGYDSANTAYYVYAQVEALPTVYGDTLSTTAGSAAVTDASATFVSDGLQSGDAFVITTGSNAGNYLVLSVDSETQVTLITPPSLTHTDASATYIDNGLQPGDNFNIASGPNAGDYVVVMVDSQTQITLSSPLSFTETGLEYYAQYPPGTAPVDQLGDPDNGINLATTAGSAQVSSSSATYINDGVQPGDTFIIATGADAGTYTVISVDSETQLTLSQAMTADNTGLHYSLGGAEDQISLYNGSGTIVDYVAWGAASATSTDFKSDDQAAVNAGIWTDNSFKNVDSTDANGIDGLIAPGEAIYRTTDGKDSDDPSDWAYQAPSINMNFVLTLAVVDAVRRYDEGGIAVVEWTTAAELGTLGYNVYRRDDGDSVWTQVNTALLTATPPDRRGAVHRLKDPGGRVDRRQWYLLEELDVRGKRHTYGPYPAPAYPGDAGPSLDADYTRLTYSQRMAAMPPAVTTLAAPRAMAAPMSTGTGTALRLTVTDTGLYFVGADVIAEGIDEVADAAAAMAAIEAGELRLHTGQQEVAYLPDTANTGLFFVAEAAPTFYSRDTVYWLHPGRGALMDAGAVRRNAHPATTVDINGNGRIDMVDALAVMQRAADVRTGRRAGAGPDPAGAGQHFPAVQTSEDDLEAGVDTLTDPDLDLWYWGATLLAAGQSYSLDLPVSAPFPATASGTSAFLEIVVLGATRTGNAVEARFNGSPLPAPTWEGLTVWAAQTGQPATLQTWVPAALLNPAGTNLLTLTAHADPAAPGTAWYLNKVRISYPREFIAENDTLVFSSGGNEVVTVSGFTGGPIRVLDITRPRVPVEIIDTTIDMVGTQRVSFRSAGPETRYLATRADTTRIPASEGVTPLALTAGAQGAEYLIITPAPLAAAAEELADHRTAQGLSARIVTLEAVMDAFNHGVSHPDAIRAFLQHAAALWTPAPRYVVLVGKGTFDYTDALGQGTNLMPPRLIGTTDGLFASDNWQADIEGGDGVPDIAIGRLPVTDAPGLTALIQKIKNYEATAAGTWNRRILMVADNDDGRVNFAANAETVAAAIPETPYTTEKVYLGVNADLAAARAAVAGGFQNGSLLIDYVGHGGMDRLAAEGIFTTGDVAALAAGSRLPILAALTCIVNRFELPYPQYTSLGEALVLSPGGAIAAWAPTGLSSNSDAEALNTAFMDALVAAPGGRLGDVILSALAGLKQHIPKAELAAVYTLLGDPALRLPAP